VGARGPVPKRESQRRRTNDRGTAAKAPSGAPVPVPDPDEGWHELARDWFVSLGRSGQSVFYEASDWQTARYVAEAMSRNLAADKFSSMLFAAVMSASASLLVTEGDRRRLRIELERAGEGDGEVSELDDYRARMRPSS
jgi:hypothetical protein